MPKKSAKKTTKKTAKKTSPKKVSTAVGKGLSFGSLVDSLSRFHAEFSRHAAKAVNVSLTLRNWLIGAYLAEFELRGADRAKYGENLIPELVKILTSRGVSGCSTSSLYSYLNFYRFYPQIFQSVIGELQSLGMEDLTQDRIFQSVIGESQKRLAEIEKDDVPCHSGTEILAKLSYTHIFQLLGVDDPYRRVFYEMECLRGGWSVRELRRQIATMYFERTALSTNKVKLREIVRKKAELHEPKMIVRDPVVFEFLGIKPNEAMLEEDVERRMLDKLQELLLEHGHGFCFEARQKRLLIGKEYFFVDLVFYHRLLKCHVLVELKNDDFRHEYIGQLNTCLTWYKRNVMAEGDQPPVGILLCTGKDETLVEYAIAGMDNNLFVSRYLAELPSREELLRIAQDET